MRISFFLFQNPFLSLYLILPFAWSPPLLNQVKEGILARYPLMYNDCTSKVSWALQGFCYVMLVVVSRQIFIDIIEGEPLSPKNFGFTFSVIILLTFLVQLVLRNLPEIKRVRRTEVTILDHDSIGIYAFDFQRFILEDITGISDEFNLVLGPQRRYKDKDTVWLAFQKNSTQSETENAMTNIGKTEVDYSYYVMVTDEPNKILVREVQLAGIESNEQLNIKIKQDFENLFYRDIYNQPQYQDLNNQIDGFLFDSRILNDDGNLELGQIVEQAIKLKILRDRLDEVTNQFRYFQKNYDLYGKLYHIKLRLNQVKLQPNVIADLEKLQDKITKFAQEAYQRTRDKEEFFRKLYEEGSERFSKNTLDEFFDITINGILGKSETPSHKPNQSSTFIPINQDNDSKKLPKSETSPFQEQLEQEQQPIQNNLTDEDSFFNQRFNGNNNY